MGEDEKGDDERGLEWRDGKVLGSTFPKRRWRLNLTMPRVIAARDPASLVQGRENHRRFGLRSDTARRALFRGQRGANNCSIADEAGDGFDRHCT